MIVEIIIGVLSILLGLAALPWVAPKLDRAYRRFHARWIIWRSGVSLDHVGRVRAIRDGSYQKVKTDYMVLDCQCLVTVNRNGDVQNAVSLLVCNTSESPMMEINLAVYSETATDSVLGWAETSGTRYPVTAYDWDKMSADGSFILRLPRALMPREAITVRYGYVFPAVYSEGEGSWWEWYMGHVYAHFALDMSFHPSWRVSGLEGMVVDYDRAPQQPSLRNNRIRWKLSAPIPGRKYRIEFALGKEMSA